MSTELVRTEPDARQAIQQLDTSQQPQDLLALAVKQGASVDTLERLMVVRTQLKAEQAREAYFAALAAFQSECPIILRSKAGHENRYNYAPLERIVKEVTPFLTRHGFSHQEDGVVTDGWVEAVVTVTHRAGHKEEKRFKVPTESKAGMSPQQKYGAAMTYATRYAFCAAFGIRTADRDTDCAPDDQAEKQRLKAELWKLLEPVRGTEKNWDMARQWLVDEMCLDPDIPVRDLDVPGFQATIKAAKLKLEGR